MSAAWAAVTVALYVAARRLHRRVPRAVLSPLLTVPAALALLLRASGQHYADYLRGGSWLVKLLGPATVAFAVPLWQHRALLRRHAGELAAGVVAGSAVAVLSSVGLARLFRLDEVVTASLAPRSVTTPLAMEVAGHIGGAPSLAAVFVIVTAVVGLVIAEVLLRWLKLRSALARGALFGMGAHAAGTARALEIGALEGAIAGLVMVLAGLLLLAAIPAVRLVLGAGG